MESDIEGSRNHARDEINEYVCEAIKMGTTFAMTNEYEIRVA